MEILSQGDNWFVFHLLSAADLQSVKRANAHFSDDILAVLLNEPIPGQGVFWSSAAAGGGMAYPIPMRALLFEDLHTLQDPHNTRGAVETFASQMRDKHRRAIADALQSMPLAVSEMDRTAPIDPNPVTILDSSDRPEDDGIDFKQTYETAAFARLVQDARAMVRLRSDVGASYGWVKYCLVSYLPETLEDRDQVAYNLVPRAMDTIFGPRDDAWYTVKVDGRVVIRVGKRPSAML